MFVFLGTESKAQKRVMDITIGILLVLIIVLGFNEYSLLDYIRGN